MLTLQRGDEIIVKNVLFDATLTKKIKIEAFEKVAQPTDYWHKSSIDRKLAYKSFLKFFSRD